MEKFNLCFNDDCDRIRMFPEIETSHLCSDNLNFLIEFLLKTPKIIPYTYITEWENYEQNNINFANIVTQVSAYELTDTWASGERFDDLSFF